MAIRPDDSGVERGKISLVSGVFSGAWNRHFSEKGDNCGTHLLSSRTRITFTPGPGGNGHITHQLGARISLLTMQGSEIDFRKMADEWVAPEALGAEQGGRSVVFSGSPARS